MVMSQKMVISYFDSKLRLQICEKMGNKKKGSSAIFSVSKLRWQFSEKWTGAQKKVIILFLDSSILLLKFFGPSLRGAEKSTDSSVVAYK